MMRWMNVATFLGCRKGMCGHTFLTRYGIAGKNVLMFLDDRVIMASIGLVGNERVCSVFELRERKKSKARAM